jgi:tetratricopeptide (TPR) repeat protein
MKVAWTIGKGNQASRRGDTAGAIEKYRAARDNARANNVAAEALVAGMLLAEELGNAGDLAAAESEFAWLAAHCAEVEAITFAGRRVRASELETQALDNLIDLAGDDRATVCDRLERLLAAATRHHDRRLIADTMARLGDACRELPDHPAAQRWYEQAATEFANLADIDRQAAVQRGWARSAELAGDAEQALRRYEQALAFYRQIGDVANQANGHGQLGDVRRSMGDLPGARAEYSAAVTLFNQAGDAEGAARAARLLE